MDGRLNSLTPSVEVGAKTGKLTSIEMNTTDISAKDNKAYDNMKLNKIKETVAPIAQKVMGIDLKGYEVKQNKEYDIRNQFIFTKKGSPTLSARVDVKGKCYSLAVTSVDGKAE
ncbi:hypothetical protein [Paenibacillus sp. MER TA 81-3]|uniref:hypothetical protein n=1 Tax=Paenibacillus sp. MER TA 81-3 TaxID=2939573 RepID=UPI002040D550|nr:hypothetical protein [Paenibacillus sp. MER TA 81-3]